MTRSSPRFCALLFASLLAQLACGPSLDDAYRADRAAAERAYNHGRYAEAAQHWQQAATQAGSRRRGYEALYRAAVSLRRAGRNAEARALFERIRSEAPRHARAAKAAYELADLKLESGDTEGGVADLVTFLHEHPSSGLAPGALRRVLQDREDRAGGSGVLAFLDQEIPRLQRTQLGERLHYAYALELESQDRLAEALKRYLLVADRYPYPQGALWDDALWKASELAERLGNPRQAIAHLERMLAQREPSTFVGSYERPRFSKARFRIAELYRDQIHDARLAREHFRMVWFDHPTTILKDDAAWQEAILAQAQGDDACPILKRLAAGVPDSRFVPCADLLCPGFRPPEGARGGECRPYIRRQLEAELSPEATRAAQRE